ncbi:MAG TPA: hypothetical protein VK540_34750 [Polyangiaceae bacterium]|nr:hypothetical protein [Polyangiaceae bacterium]
MKWQLGWFVLPIAAAIGSSCNNGENGTTPPAGTGGTGGSSHDPLDAYVPPPPAPSDWCSTRKVLQDNCTGCHFPGTPWATVPLVALEDMYAQLQSGKLAYQAVKERIHDDKAPMPPTADKLTPVELATIDNWVAAGAPRGADPTCSPPSDDAGDGAGGSGGAGGAGGAGGVPEGGTDVNDGGRIDGDAGDADAPDTGTDGGKPPTGWPDDCEDRYTVVAHGQSRPNDTTKFNVSASGTRDYYQCFLFKAPWGATAVQGLRFRPIIDDGRVVARYMVYGLDSLSSGTDGQVGANGCRNGTLLQAWAPGGTETELPATVGMQMPRGANAFVALEIQYDNTANNTNAMDASGVEFCVTKKLRPNTASVHWLGSTNITLPRGQTDVTNTCDPTSTQSSNLIAVQPWMNRFGTRARLVLNRAGMPQTLHDAPFLGSSQATYPLTAVVDSGSTLTTTCTYNNTTTTTVRYGDTMADENCYNLVTAWPAGSLSGLLQTNRCISLF